MPHIGAIALVVRDYDEALAFYVDTLGFDLVEDTSLGSDKRWVLVAPPGGQTRLLLAKAATPDQAARSAIRLAAASSCSCRATISSRITIGCAPPASIFSSSPERSLTAPSRCSRISMAIAGICCS